MSLYPEPVHPFRLIHTKKGYVGFGVGESDYEGVRLLTNADGSLRRAGFREYALFWFWRFLGAA